VRKALSEFRFHSLQGAVPMQQRAEPLITSSLFRNSPFGRLCIFFPWKSPVSNPRTDLAIKVSFVVPEEL